MSLRKETYINRLIDEKISDYLTVYGAISIEGPKWCGKTWTSLNHVNSAINLDDKKTRDLAKLDIESVIEKERPLLIDEWNRLPEIWDKIRNKCDEIGEKGNYILTCSTRISDDIQKEEIHHSGAGRIGRINMSTMSLYESGDSTGEASILEMFNDTQKSKTCKTSPRLKELANLIIRGGWPSNISVPEKNQGIVPKGYIDALLNNDINEDKDRNKNKMLMLLKSLARNESTVVSNLTLLRDIKENEDDDVLKNRDTLDEYLDVLNRLHLLENQNAYSSNYRSKDRVGKSPKRHFVDPSLACALLDLTPDKLIDDLKTFGFLFEALVERDLRIYMEYLDGKLYHFRDNVSGLEVDSILEFQGGEYAAVEIKLGLDKIEEAKENLIKFANNSLKKPKFMCIITGICDVTAKDQETGIYIVPITALKP